MKTTGKKFWLAVLLLAAFILSAPSAEAAFGYRKKITIQGSKISGALSNFPVLVNISEDNSLMHTVYGGRVHNNNGYDIVFRDSDGTTPLDHEVDEYIASKGDLIAWVKVPGLSSGVNKEIYIYYGDSTITYETQNPTAVWADGFKGVWHLNSPPNNSSGNYNNGTSSSTTDPLAKIGNGSIFNGMSSSISTPSYDLKTANDFTISLWFKTDSTSQRHMVWQGDASGNGWGNALSSPQQEMHISLGHVGSTSTTNRLSFFLGDTDIGASADVLDITTEFTDTTDWNHVAVVVTNMDTSPSAAMYLNGDLKGSDSGTTVRTDRKNWNSGFRMGRPGASQRYYDGTLDEVRISTVARSVAWIETEVQNQSSPSTFYLLGAEEYIGGPIYHQITATAGTFGSISPSPSVQVQQGSSQTFTVTATVGYQVYQVLVNGVAATLSNGQYTFSNVQSDHSISVSFEPIPSGTPSPDPTVPISVPGCAMNVTKNYGQTGFVASEFSLTSVDITSDKMMMLNTGFNAIDPNRIIIPFNQEVAVTFLYEGAGYLNNDFGWMLAAGGSGGTKQDIYLDINDNNHAYNRGNGVLDIGPNNTANRFGDRNGDGVVNALDNREVIGTFEAGTELVFYLRARNATYGIGDLAPSTETPVYFYTKTDWNKDVYRGSCTNNPLVKTYYLGRGLTTEGNCNTSSNWMVTESLDRARDLFGLEFDYDDSATLTIHQGQKFPHVMVGAPRSNPNAWILGWEDLAGGGDTDHNDLVFIIERRTGGRAELNNPIVPQAAESYYTGVSVTVFDHMPCGGKTELKYYVSIDNGANWVAINSWDEIWESDASKGMVRQLTSWAPGEPAYTMRKVRIDLVGRGLTGRELVWKADFFSDQVGCEPKVMDVILDADAATNGPFSRSSPVVKANMVYSGFYETPANSWRDKSLRGHLTATQLYDPLHPETTSTLQMWDAGAKLTASGPAARTIYFPQISVGDVSDETVPTDNSTNGVERIFSGKFSPVPIMTTTLSITDGRETFIDKHTNILEGNRGGRGTINRFTGEFSITFNEAPMAGVPIRASYQFYSSEKDLKRFESSNVTKQLLGLDDSYIIPTGYVYDFDRDNDVDNNDAHWLMNWVRGYELGTSTKREWLLEPIDHSTPALLTVPGQPLWYFGTATSKAEQASFDQFSEAQKNRGSVIFAGSRGGMLHAFDAGDFRYGDNACTTGVTEERGYFKWNSDCPPAPSTPDPNYGTGDELWAFIPANLLPRLKNNLLAKMNRERSTDYDQAYVDASPALADVYINNAWRTVLLSAQGNGGDTVFCLDVTNPLSPTFMWEFADPDLFRSRSSPSIAKIGRIVRNGKPKWVAFFVSGNDDRYDRTQYPSVYMIDIETGAVLERIFLTADTGGLAGVPSGQPSIVDSDGNGYIDRFYIGTDKGFMYKVNIPDDPDAVKYNVNQCVINRDYTDTNNASVSANWQYQPIYGSPVVSVNNTVNSDFSLNYKVRVFYGTGDSPYYKDDINTANTRYHFFAYEDTAPKGVCNESMVGLDWFYELPEGHRVFASAFAAAGTIYFGTSTAETEDPCESGGLSSNNGSLFAFDMNNPRDTQGSVIPKLSEKVGNMVSPPVVYDQHLFYKSFDGSPIPRVLGGAGWNTETISVPNGVEVLVWREVY